tara:strand:- start:169092 stop:169634 length:543 start_codon:yes stop_codon:yes gene_type:complete
MWELQKGERIRQGDILEEIEYSYIVPNKKELLRETYPYVLVLTQDCDLKQDHEAREQKLENKDKFLESILLLPAFLKDDFKTGEHLSMLGLNRLDWGNGSESLWKNILSNGNKRFHHLKKDQELELPDLIIDFKFFFTMRRDDLEKVYKEKYLASIKPLYREDLSVRFTHYLSRIGLPTS